MSLLRVLSAKVNMGFKTADALRPILGNNPASAGIIRQMAKFHASLENDGNESKRTPAQAPYSSNATTPQEPTTPQAPQGKDEATDTSKLKIDPKVLENPCFIKDKDHPGPIWYP